MCVELFTVIFCVCVFFFFKQKTAYEMRISDWSSDVCSSDLGAYSGYRCSLSWILPPDRLPVRRQCCTHFIEDGVGQRRGAARRGDSGGIPLVALQVGARADDLLAVVAAHHVLLQSAAVAVAGDGGERLLHCLRSDEHP